MTRARARQSSQAPPEASWWTFTKQGALLAFDEESTHALPEHTRGDHVHIHLLRRPNMREGDVVPGGEVERLARPESWLHVLLVHARGDLVGDEHEAYTGLLGCLPYWHGREAVRLGLLPTLVADTADQYVLYPGGAHVQRLDTALDAVPDHGDCPPVEPPQVGVRIVEDLGHFSPSRYAAPKPQPRPLPRKDSPTTGPQSQRDREQWSCRLPGQVTTVHGQDGAGYE